MRGDGKTRCYDFTCKCTFRYLWMNAPLLIALACNLAFRISYFLILEATPDIQIWSNRSQTTDKSIKHTRYWAACYCAFQVRKWQQQKRMGGEQVQRNFWLIVWRGYDLVISPLGYFRSVWFWNDFEGSERCNEQCDGCSFYYYYYYYRLLLLPTTWEKNGYAQKYSVSNVISF